MLKTHFLEIKNFLKPISHIWEWEILNFFPESLNSYPTELLHFFDSLTDEEIWAIDSFHDLTKLQNFPLTKDLMGELLELIKLPKLPKLKISQPQLNDKTFLFVKHKKAHEIAHILKKLEGHSFKTSIEIGGGKGHLSRIISQHFSHHNRTAIVADQDAHLLELGEKHVTQFNHHLDIHFINHLFNEDNHHEFLKKIQHSQLKNLHAEKYLTIGLHTCGPLSLYHFRLALSLQADIFNFPCCYANLNPLIHVNISQFSQDNSPLTLNTHALSLATRGYSTMDFKSFLLKKRVKFYRFALHLLLREKFHHKNFIAVGESPAKHYLGSFANYANIKLHQNGFKTLDENQLEKFYNSQEIQKTYTNMFYANIYRWLFGRLLEHYIIWDRALYLEENNYNVEIMEYFDQNISPRNIGIFAKRQY